MTIYFTNPGEIDIEAAMTLGVNAKENDNPIGAFGTGLKYAIAVLLRSGHKITIHSGLASYEFSTQERTTRSITYQQVLMNGEPLGFTSSLGKNWQVWQAFRELYSNALDENGVVSDSHSGQPHLGETIIEVRGQEISQVYCDRWKYFLQGEPLAKDANVEIHPGHNIFYRGILVQETPTAFAYNLTSGVTLSEDRGIANTWSVQWDIARAIASQTNPTFFGAILAKGNSPEHNYPWNSTLSSSNKKLMRTLHRKDSLPLPFHGIATTLEVEEGEVDSRSPTGSERGFIEVALEQLKALDLAISAPILISDGLSSGTWGMAKNGKIYLTSTLFAQGQTRITGTLLEEHLHLAHGFADCTRRFQNHLVDLLATAAAQLTLSPLERGNEVGPYDAYASSDQIPF